MDARSLLRAKKAESRIEHPHASYTTAGQLRCSICAIPVKQWDAHLLTKQHRASVTREKTSAAQSKVKRPAEGEATNSESKRARTAGASEEVVRSSILPAGFFSSGSGPTIVADEDEEEEEEEEPVKAGPSKTVKAPTTATTTTTVPASSAPTTTGQTGDVELDSFLASLAEPDPEPSTSEAVAITPATAPTAAAQKAATTKKATSTYRDIIPGQASYEAAPVRNIPKDQEAAEVEPEVQESEAEKRARIAREEREDIMDRLEEEERAQEDGDSRVAALKQRMEMLKKRREAKAKTAKKAI